jgi:hypothetical protein
VPQLSARLIQRIEADFPHHVAVVRERLAGLDDLIEDSGQDHERLLAAVIRVAAGRLKALDQALDLARNDWRDLLVAADLADAAWSSRLSARLDPPQPRDTASPGARGELTEADGHLWLVQRRRIDLRMVKRLLRRADVIVMLGEAGGFQPRRVPHPERASVWETVRHAYVGPGGTDQTVSGTDYIGHEFTDSEGTVMLYLEERC